MFPHFYNAWLYYPIMPDYFGFTRDDPSIIAKEEVLNPNYLPDELFHRDAELQAIADAIKPILQKKCPDNLFIYGSSGTGKTACVRYILRQLSEHSSNVLPVYVNCWEHYTQLAVYNRIIEEMKLPIPRRGMATDEVFDRIIQYTRNYKKPILIVLDELDGLRSDELLYVLGRSNEKSGVLFGILAVTNNGALLASMDSRIRSSLRFSGMEFRSYTEEQLFGILRTRAEAGLVPGSWDERLLRKIAGSVPGCSAREAIHLLWKSAKHAEKKSNKKIMLQDFEDIAANECVTSRLRDLNLCKEEKLILDILREGGMNTSELYAQFMKEIPKTKRQIRNYIELLERKCLIESESIESDSTIKPRIIRLRN